KKTKFTDYKIQHELLCIYASPLAHSSPIEQISQPTQGNIVVNEQFWDPDDLEEETWDCCGSEKCLRPTGKTLKWIQCEVCYNWHHFDCVGLDESRNYKETFFACIPCWRPRSLIPTQDGENSEAGEEEEIIDIDPLGISQIDFSGFCSPEMLNHEKKKDNMRKKKDPIKFGSDVNANYDEKFQARIGRRAAKRCRDLISRCKRNKQL
ncbi:unnamed protein product, partial [Meganyctiphanes norvegica]